MTGGPAMDLAFFTSWIEEAARAVSSDRERLTALDAAIGDADHGSNLDRGFTAVAHALGTAEPATPGALLTLVGTTLIRKVGGASGPLYGTFFREAGKALGDDAEVPLARLHAALEAGLAGVRALGSAAEGDKTMVDALAPAVRALEEAVRDGGDPAGPAGPARTADPAGPAGPAEVAGAIGAAVSAAHAGAEATIPLQARKGRASYLGPRSVGHEDPGAASAALILAALHAVATRW